MAKPKKLAALLMVAFLLVLLVPMVSSAANSNQLISALPLQADTQPKLTTEPLGAYVSNGNNLTYDYVMSIAFNIPELNLTTSSTSVAFIFSSGSWGDWFLVNMTSDGSSLYFAIHNTTREIGLNSSGGLFTSAPGSASEIHRQTGVYSFLALPTGISVGSIIPILIPLPGAEEEPVLMQITLTVMGRIVSPTMGGSEQPKYYDSWMLQGTFQNASVSLVMNHIAEYDTGLLLSTMMGVSTVYQNSEVALLGVNLMSQFNSTKSTPNILNPIQNTNVTSFATAESTTLTDKTFNYTETGYWYIDLTPVNATWGLIRLDNLAGSYINWTLRDPVSEYYIPMNVGLSQVVKIPDNLWSLVEQEGSNWNDSYYDSATHTGTLQEYLEGDYGIMNLTRFAMNGSNQVMLIHPEFLAPPWIREGILVFLSTVLPMFIADPDQPSFGPLEGQPMSLMMPFRVTRALPLSIGGNVYDCWEATMMVPTNLSSLNVTQMSFTVYFERNSGIMLKARADFEAKMPNMFDGGELVNIGYHKTWTISEVDGTSPTPQLFNSFHNVYNLSIPADEQHTLDPSFFAGASVTVNCSQDVEVSMWTQTQSGNNLTINGLPIVKFIYVEHNASGANFNATVSFYYTVTELLAKGAKEAGLTIYFYNGTSGWVPLNTTVDAPGRVVSANTTHFSVFALVAAPLTIWDILGPIGSAILLDYLMKSINPPMGGLMIPLIGISAAIIVAVVIAALFLAKKH